MQNVAPDIQTRDAGHPLRELPEPPPVLFAICLDNLRLVLPANDVDEHRNSVFACWAKCPSIMSLPMSEFTLRRATAADAVELTQLSFDTFWDAFARHPMNAPHDLDDYMRRAFTVEQIAAEFNDPKSIFMLAMIDGVMAGYSKLILDTIEPGIIAQRPIELSRLYSHQKYLGKGIGQTLMDRCFEDARGLGRDVMWLGVWEYNPRAQTFYAKNGFRIVGKHVFQLGTDPQTDLLMQKEV
jgi:ribosomal protein S18 acetylase RimI-like enzyme